MSLPLPLSPAQSKRDTSASRSFVPPMHNPSLGCLAPPAPNIRHRLADTCDASTESERTNKGRGDPHNLGPRRMPPSSRHSGSRPFPFPPPPANDAPPPDEMKATSSTLPPALRQSSAPQQRFGVPAPAFYSSPPVTFPFPALVSHRVPQRRPRARGAPLRRRLRCPHPLNHENEYTTTDVKSKDGGAQALFTARGATIEIIATQAAGQV